MPFALSGATLVGATSGTAFPTGMTAGHRHYRTDLARWAYYDGTRWLGEAIQTLVFSQRVTFPLAPTTATTHDATLPQDYGIWLERWSLTAYVNGTNNVSNYWTFTLFADNGSNTRTNLGSVNTSAVVGSAWRPLALSSFGSNGFAAAAQTLINIDTSVVGTPANLYLATSIRYREVLT